MPTSKPKIQIILDEDTYKILQELAEKEMRSMSQMGGYIVKKYIEEYESKEKRSKQKSDLEESLISGAG